MKTFFFFSSNETINRNCKIVISGRGVKGWELVSQRTWVDPHFHERSHAWAGRGGGHCSLYHSETTSLLHSNFNILSDVRKMVTVCVLPSRRGTQVSNSATGEAHCTAGLPAGHRGAGLSAASSALRRLIPTSAYGSVFGCPEAQSEHQPQQPPPQPDLSYLTRVENEWRNLILGTFPCSRTGQQTYMSPRSLPPHFSLEPSPFSLFLWQTQKKLAVAHEYGVSLLE